MSRTLEQDILAQVQARGNGRGARALSSECAPIARRRLDVMVGIAHIGDAAVARTQRRPGQYSAKRAAERDANDAPLGGGFGRLASLDRMLNSLPREEMDGIHCPPETSARL